MLTDEMKRIIEDSKKTGWVLEPDAKKLFTLAGFDVPLFAWAKTPGEATSFAADTGYPVVAKVVSPKVLHKSDVGGVILDIENDEQMRGVFDRLSSMEAFDGIVVEETVRGVELIIGAKVDVQFGPVVLMGIGGVGVELYSDTTIRMAPIERKDVHSMIGCLKARKLLEGFRGAEPVNMEILVPLVVNFSKLVMELEGVIESIDLNPVLCSSTRCVVADARIILT